MSTFDNTNYEKTAGQAASYGQTNVNTAGTGAYDQANTGTYGQSNTNTYGQTTTGTYGQTNTDTYGQTNTNANTLGQTNTGNYGQSTGTYPEAAYTTGYNTKPTTDYTSTNYNATAPEGVYGQTGGTGAGYGEYSDPNSQPPPNYIAAKTEQIRTYYTPEDSSLAWKRRFCTAFCCCLCLGLIIGLPAGFTSGHNNAGCECWNNNDCYSYYGPGVYCYSDCRCYRG